MMIGFIITNKIKLLFLKTFIDENTGARFYMKTLSNRGRGEKLPTDCACEMTQNNIDNK